MSVAVTLEEQTDGEPICHRLDGHETPVVKFGRMLAGAGVKLDDPQTSRLHAALKLSGARPELIDLGSTLGTMVNGVPIYQTELSPGDVITMGSVTFQVLPDAADGESTDGRATLDATPTGLAGEPESARAGGDAFVQEPPSPVELNTLERFARWRHSLLVTVVLVFIPVIAGLSVCSRYIGQPACERLCQDKGLTFVEWRDINRRATQKCLCRDKSTQKVAETEEMVTPLGTVTSSNLVWILTELLRFLALIIPIAMAMWVLKRLKRRKP